MVKLASLLFTAGGMVSAGSAVGVIILNANPRAVVFKAGDTNSLKEVEKREAECIKKGYEPVHNLGEQGEEVHSCIPKTTK